MPKPSAESAYRLLVEGPDDFHTVIHLMARHGFDWDDENVIRPFVSEEGGVDRLLRTIPVALKGRYQRLGVVLDANSDLAGRWVQVRDRARREGLDFPDSPHPDGMIVSGRLPESRFGVWLMPDNTSNGALETFLSQLIPGEDPIRSYADEAVVTARQRGARCREKDHAKSLLHTWLAWQEEPGVPFGTALKSEYFEKDSDEAHRFVAWFRRLFVQP